MTMPKGWSSHVPAKRHKKTEKTNFGEKEFLLDVIRRTLETYSNVFVTAKEDHDTRSNLHLSGYKEIRNNLVGMAAFVATLILAILATTSNPSLENAIVDIIRTNSAIILGADIIFAVGSFIGINLFTLAVGKQYSVMVEGYQTVLITITALSDFINKESLDIVSIKPNQLRVFSQFIRIAVNGNRIKLFDAFKQASTRKFFSPLTKGAYRNAALLQRIEMDLVYDVYSSYRDELFKEREFLKEVLPFLESFVKRYNKAKKIPKDRLVDFMDRYTEMRFGKLDLKNEDLLSI